MYEKDPVKIFVVEDDPAYTKFLKYVLGLNPDYEVEFYHYRKRLPGNFYKNPASYYARLFPAGYARRTGA